MSARKHGSHHEGSALTVAEHRMLVETQLSPLPPVSCPILTADPRDGALGTILAADITAKLAVPPFTNSAMDGFAVRFEDIEHGTTLPVAGDIPAGDTVPHELVAGTAWRIMTGARMPAGADTVIKVEHTDHAPGTSQAPSSVTIVEAAEVREAGPGATVRHAGENVQPGDPVLPAGTLLDAAGLSAATSAGYRELLVHPAPRVGVIATGTELVDAGSALAAGQIPDSNSVLLQGLVNQAGGRVVAMVRSNDDPDHLRAALAGWHDVDLVFTAGGISAGAYEVVRQVLANQNPGGTSSAQGAPTVDFHHVAQQPGGPQGIGRVRVGSGRTACDVPVLCLPGNPVSVFVSFAVYGAGAIAMLAGRAVSTEPDNFEVAAGSEWDSPGSKVQFMPLALSRNTSHVEVPTATPIHRLGSRSHLVASLPLADGLGVVPVGVDHVAAGDRLRFIPTRVGMARPARPTQPAPTGLNAPASTSTEQGRQ